MNSTFRVGEWHVDFDLGQISDEGRTTRVKPKAMRLLLYLIENAGEVLTKKHLIETVWHGAHVSDDVLTHAISELRKAFGDNARSAKTIETIPKRGYRLLAPLLTEASARRPHSGPLRLAVLPFENLSGDPRQESFVRAMTDILIADLARAGLFRVISRTSTLGYEQQGKMLSTIARELEADLLVEGTVVCSGKRVRATVRLLNARDENLWAEIYEQQLNDSLTAQQELALSMAEGINQHRI